MFDIVFILLSLCTAVDSFILRHTLSTHLHSSTTTYLGASPSSSYKPSPNRSQILKRNGPYFKLNRFSGRVEFGSTANLVTTLPNANSSSIAKWLTDEKQVALSIWQEDLLKDLGSNLYQLELMTLQFVTIQLAPRVEARMWTQLNPTDQTPIFRLQSEGFDPNIQLLPGMNIPASALGIEIEVVGELRPSIDGKGVTGRIGFVSGGDLPPPMRMLPEGILKGASDAICKTVSDFAIQSFQQGARNKYKEFRLKEEKEETTDK